LLLVVALVAFRAPLATHGKVWLLLTQVLPQVPIKPLHALTAAPTHQQIQIDAPHGPVVADLFVPTPRFGTPAPGAQPALILALGVPLREPDRPPLLELADTLARLGFVVLWPRSVALDAGTWLPEDPATFITSVRYLEGLDVVDAERISIFGVSIGASIALVAASDPGTADRVRALVSFGGYYDAIAYVRSLATHTALLDGQVIPWQPSDDALDQARAVLGGKQLTGVLEVLETSAPDVVDARLRSLPVAELDALRAMSPAEHIVTLRAATFILHDQGDHYVPYVESVKLQRALPAASVRSFLLTSLFQHTQIGGGLSSETLGDVANLYGFVHAVLPYL
jgi:hypothetical protein